MANGSQALVSRRPGAIPVCETLERRLLLSGSVVINEFQAINDTTLADEDGQYVDWIELHNPTASAVALDGWHLTDDADDPFRWTFPDVSLEAGGYLLVYASDKDRTDGELHTSFKLTGDGEYLALIDAAGAVVHAYDPQFPPQMGDFSYGLYGGESHYFDTPTPGAPNAAPYGLVMPVTFSVDHGIFLDASDAFTLELTTPTAGATIWYTVNGDDPTDPAGTRTAYTGPITLDRTRVIRAAGMRSGFDPSVITTQTYIFLDSVLDQGPDQSELGMPPTWYNTNGGSSTSNPEGFVRDADYEVDPDVPLTAADLLDIPAIALTVTNDDLFDPATGIYVNPIQHVQTDVDPVWEKPASLELIDPAGETDFSLNAGARISGELARWVICNAKFNFRMTFEADYGPTKLETDFFGDSDVDRFDTVIMRGMWGESWLRDPTLKPPEYPNYPNFVSGSPVRTTYLHDQFAHDTFGATGNVSVEGRFVHLYLNGVYWGLYQVIERPDNSFNAQHYGGEKEDWDVFKGSVGTTDINGTLHDGRRDSWDYLFSFFDFNGTSNTTNVTPISNEDYQIIKQYLDVENLADYMITLCYIGRYDFPRKNWYAAGLPGEPGEPMIEPFRFYTWDSEASLSSNGANRTQLGESASDDTGPVRLYRRLRHNEEFQLMFADRLQKHFFNDGAMTPEKSAERLQRRADEIYTALMGESARWGDFSTPYNDDPLLRDVQWIDEINWLMNDYFPVRTDTVLEQFRSIGLYPSFDAPQLSRHGGLIHAGDEIAMSGPGGLTIYYTVDGADPRDPGQPGDPGVELTLADEDAAKRVLIPTVANGGDQLGTSWLMPGFDDGDWIAGTGGVGYDRSGTNYDPYFDIDVEDEMEGVNTSAFIRIPFTVSAEDLEELTWMSLGVRCDDGFVAYLNGVKIAEDNNEPDATPGVPQWDNEAVTYTNEGDSATLRTWNANAFVDALQEGENILAIHGLNAGIGSSDFLLSAELTAGGAGSSGTPGGVAATAVAYSGPFELDQTTTVKARAYNGSTWSALTEAVFTVDASADLRITEINYHPHDPTPAELAIDPDLDDNDFEFIELANIGTAAIGLSGVKFTDGITFDFSTSPVTVLDPGEYVVVVADPAAFALRYGSTPRIAGTYDGALANNGERLTLVDDTGAIIHDFAFDDGGAWPGRADGKGSTLEVVDTAGDYDDDDTWRSSRLYGGTPGAAAPAIEADVVINEVLTHTDEPLRDAIELLNVSDHPVDLGGWVLSDSSDTYAKYEIPAGTILAAGEYIVFDESDFNVPGRPNAFALNADRGEDVWLLATDAAGALVRFVDHVEFGAAPNGESFGRYPDGAGELVPMAQRTLGAANADPRSGPVIISEVMYNPDGQVVMPVAAIIDEDFDADAGPFTYADDVFGTGNPIFADGAHVPGGHLEVTVGRGAPEATSGGWSATFSLSEAATVTVTLEARLQMSGQFGLGDYGEAVLAIDGVRHGPGDDFSLIHIDGNGAGGADVDTGWINFSVPVALEAGEHTLTLAAYNNVPSEVEEFVTAAFDNVSVTGPLERHDLEYIEIHNPTDAAVDLTGWRLRNGVDYDFDDGTMLPAGGRLVVLPFNPDNADNAARVAFFRSVYGLDASVPLVGGWAGRLENAGERVELQRPGEPPAENPDFTPHTIEDDVDYEPTAPWPTSADGAGDALVRIGGWGRDVQSWAARTPSPGSAGVSADFDGDGDVDLDDFATLKQNFGLTGTATRQTGDSNGDGNVDLDDFAVLKLTFGTAASSAEVTGQSDTLLADTDGGRDDRAVRRHRRRRVRTPLTPHVDLLATARLRPLGGGR